MRGAIVKTSWVLLTFFLLSASAVAQAASTCSGLSCFFRGQLVEQRTSLRLSARDFTKLLSTNATGQQLLQIAGTPRCDIEIKYFR